MKLADLLEQRAAAVDAMRVINTTAEKENRDYSADEDKRHGELKTEIAKLDTQIQRARDLDDADRRAPGILLHGNGRDGNYEDRARGFSLVRRIRAACGESVDDGADREISQEVERRAGRSFSGIAVPDEYFYVERWTLLAGTTAADLVPTTHRPDLFVDSLRAQLVTGRLGATILNGLVGNVEIPRQVTSSTAQHVAEDAALTETDPTIDDVTLAPTTVGALTSFSRRTLINAVPSVEALVRADLAAVIASAIDFQALLGDGTLNTPTGVGSEPGISTFSLAGPTWAQVLAAIATIESDNANIGAMGWAMNPDAVAKLRATTKVSTDAGAGFLADSPTSMAGFTIASTSAIPQIVAVPNTHQVFFGAWSQLLIGFWSGVDVLANPFSDTSFTRGRVQVRAMRDYDVAVRHAQSFARATDLPL